MFSGPEQEHTKEKLIVIQPPAVKPPVVDEPIGLWWVKLHLPQLVAGVDMWAGVAQYPYIQFMAQFYGEKEFSGKDKNNSKITQFFKWANGKMYPDEVMWCMAAVMGSLQQTGYEYIKSLWAKDAEKLGDACELIPGCVATKFSKAANSKRHVFFVIYVTKDYVWGFGGNQSNMFCVQRFDRKDIRATRMPRKIKQS